MRPMVDPGDHHTAEEEQDDVDKRNVARLRAAGAKGESVFHSIGRGFKAVAGFRMYLRVGQGPRQMLGEMWNGEKANQRARPPKPFPSFKSSGGQGFTLRKSKKAKR